jgi:hypothetical protein
VVTQSDGIWQRVKMRTAATAVLSLALATGALLGPAQPGNAALSTQPTLQQIPNAGVHAMLQRSGWLYLAGSFTTLTDPTTHAVVSRERLARIKISTGAVDPTWHPSVDGDVRALTMSAGGLTLDLAGSFTHINGSARPGLGAVSTTSSSARAWNPKPNGVVRALLTVGNNIAIGGSFSKVDGKVHHNVALVAQKTGKQISAFDVSTNHGLYALARSTTGKAIYLGGAFTTVGTVGAASRAYIAKVSAKTGAVTTWKPSAACSAASNPASNPCYVLSIAVSGERVFAGVSGPGGRVVAYDIDSGKALWRDYLDGDAQALAVSGSTLYVGGHFSNITDASKFPAFAGLHTQTVGVVAQATGAVDTSFTMTVHAPHPGVWSLLPVTGGLAVGGDVQQVDGTSINYLTVFDTATES